MNGHLPRALTLAGLLCALVVGFAGAAAPATAGTYTPPSGITVSNPLGTRDERRTIIGMLIKSIDSTPARATIRVASWNIRSDDVVAALISAHKRGVGVRVIVDIGNANAKNPNEGVDMMRAALARGNKHRNARLRSGVVECIGSCRGLGGLPHTKFFLFSKVGRSEDVVINTSANATDLAASSQWNDAYVVRRNPTMFKAFRRNFEQMWHDTPVAQPYVVQHDGDMTAMFYPFEGAKTGKDPIIRELDRVACHNADGSRTTKIRIAMTSWYGDRGIAIATKIRDLANQGCDIRIVYAVTGNEALRILRRLGPTPVPMQQIVQDFDGDGVYDRYLHSKVLTIKGTYRHRQAAVAINGSANWSPKVLQSDEAVLRLQGTKPVNTYNHWIDGLYENPPVNTPLMLSRRGVFGPINPYGKIQEN